MASLQEQARALGDPTRHAVFRYLADAPAPVGVAELTEHFGFNHNAIRQHLTKLVKADLVVEAKAISPGPGRPRLVYSVDAAADGRWGSVGPYERLSSMLAEIIRTGDTPVEVGRREGRSTGASGDGVSSMRDAMAAGGFDPRVEDGGERVDIVLGACPFASTAVSDPDTVCALHLGLAQGVAETARGVVVDELVRQDPRRAMCRLRLRVSTD